MYLIFIPYIKYDIRPSVITLKIHILRRSRTSPRHQFAYVANSSWTGRKIITCVMSEHLIYVSCALDFLHILFFSNSLFPSLFLSFLLVNNVRIVSYRIVIPAATICCFYTSRYFCLLQLYHYVETSWVVSNFIISCVFSYFISSCTYKKTHYNFQVHFIISFPSLIFIQ